MIRNLVYGFIALLVVLAVLAGIALVKWGQIASLQGMDWTQPPEVVSTAEAKKDSWEVKIPAVGSVVAVEGVDLSAEVSGVVKRIAFESGSAVKKGDVLVELDDSVEQAELKASQASLDLAEVSLKRMTDLKGKDAVAQADLDVVESQARAARAQVENIRAMIAKKVIRAPLSGITGIRLVNTGQFLNAGTTIVPIHSLDPVFVNFSLPQQMLGKLGQGYKVLVKSDAYEEEIFEGKLTAIDSDVDQATRSVWLQATVPSEKGRLRPGMFVSVEVVLPKPVEVVYIPATAVLSAPFGDTVFVVSEERNEKGELKRTVMQRVVRLGVRRGDFVAVNGGVKAGEVIVSNGAFKLRNGMSVEVNNDLAPKASFDPKPVDS